MKYDCELVRDLIPLYIDDVASGSSRRIVEEHLDECPDCQKFIGRLRNDETESLIEAEREEVIAGQRRYFRRNSAIAGSVIAGIFAIPILVCLIVNLASGSGLGWFFIVLSALLAAGSLSVVPLMVPENKGLWTLGSFAASLLLLLGVCCILTGGRWFFIAASAVLFGLSLIFLPFAVKSPAFSRMPREQRGAAVMAADTALFLLMMLAIGLRVQSLRYFVIALAVSIPLLLIAWAVFLIVRKAQARKAAMNPPARMGDEASGSGKVRTGTLLRPVPGSSGQSAKKKGLLRHLRPREIVFLIAGFPIWLPIVIAAFAVLLTLFVVLWALVISLWAVEVSLIGSALGSIAAGIVRMAQGGGAEGLIWISGGLVLAGLSILLVFGCTAAGKGAARLTKNTVLFIGNTLFQEKEDRR